jgi:hypothetical protein
MSESSDQSFPYLVTLCPLSKLEYGDLQKFFTHVCLQEIIYTHKRDAISSMGASDNCTDWKSHSRSPLNRISPGIFPGSELSDFKRERKTPKSGSRQQWSI